jgi:peptidoglycan/xylan/chitin deacetylase (PgdA/CDA1 family)
MSARSPWVCLMYHDVTPEAPRAGGGPARFTVPLVEFRRQLDELVAAGYAGRSLREVLSASGGNAVAITFDDGDVGQYSCAFPELLRRGMTATFFVTTDWVGKPAYMSLAQLREIQAAGMDVQSHTKTHAFLSEMDAAALTSELRDAKRMLDDSLAQDTDMLALPGGDWPRRPLRSLIAEAGYHVVATSSWGVNRSGVPEPNRFVRVRRCTVSGTAGPDRFRRIMHGDPWLAQRRRARETMLGTLRRALGPTRYAAWRRGFLDTIMD